MDLSRLRSEFIMSISRGPVRASGPALHRWALIWHIGAPIGFPHRCGRKLAMPLGLNQTICGSNHRAKLHEVSIVLRNKDTRIPVRR